MTIIYLAIGAGVFALAYAALLTIRILKSDAGSEQVQAIGRAIQEGAMAFLSREYRLLAIFVVIMFIVLAVFIDLDVLDKIPGDSESVPKTAISYLVGAIGSGLAGFIGMSIAVRANTRTTVQAQRG
ncbi:MAG TPA: sodium-translocating pyrophosphatase, partial [Dehalococcoidia bacterium]|nr:sodium-translocating pyrophosphatase [Dehalococcoidia bacterium]